MVQIKIETVRSGEKSPANEQTQRKLLTHACMPCSDEEGRAGSGKDCSCGGMAHARGSTNARHPPAEDFHRTLRTFIASLLALHQLRTPQPYTRLVLIAHLTAIVAVRHTVSQIKSYHWTISTQPYIGVDLTAPSVSP